MKPIALDDLRPGDVLLYRGRGLFGFLIRLKTWSNVSHCEMYFGAGRSAASRDGLGVSTFPFRWTGLKYVLRPRHAVNMPAGRRWHHGVSGQKYDWLGLFIFFLAAKQGHLDKMFCSEHTARLANAMGYKPFGEMDCDRISPGMFLASPAYDIVWRDDD
jgi:hypothetical protein